MRIDTSVEIPGTYVDRVYKAIENQEQVIPHQDFLRAGLMDKSPLYRLYNAIEVQIGRGRSSDKVGIYLDRRDWDRISRMLEMMFGIHYDD